MPKDDAPNYRKSELDNQFCSNCLFGQTDNTCELYGFEYEEGWICDSWQGIKNLELKAPHGYLMWKGRKKAVASDVLLETDRSLVVTVNGEAYGIVTLDKAIEVSSDKFFEFSELHKVRKHEKEAWWPDASKLFVYPIRGFAPYQKIRVWNDKKNIVEDYLYTNEEMELLKNSKFLPKTIILREDVVCIGDTCFWTKVNNQKVDGLILDTFGKPKGSPKGEKEFPIYDLAFVRKPVIRSKDVEIGDKQMWTIMEDDEGMSCIMTPSGEALICLEDPDVADNVIQALNTMMIGTPEEEPEEIPEEEIISIEGESEDKQFDEDPWDGSASNWDTSEAYCEDCLLDFNPPGEDKVKGLCKLPYRLPGKQLPNKNALQAIAGGNGITAVVKPDEVSQDDFVSKISTAAKKVISWYPEAFDKDAPDSIQNLVKGEKAGKRINNRMLSKLNEIIESLKNFLTWAQYDEEDKKSFNIKGATGFYIKDVDGEPWHFTWSTNAFKDRHGEIFSTKALEDYVNASDQYEEKGFFNFWHIPGTDFAKKEFQAVSGRILIEAGPYLKNEAGEKAKKFFSAHPKDHAEIAPQGWGASPEYFFRPGEPDGDGVYNWLWIDRTSSLPRVEAANLFTKSSQENVMGLADDPKKKQAAVAIFGDKFVEDLISSTEEATAELERNVSFKEEEEEVVVSSEGDVEEVPEEEKEEEDVVTQVVKQVMSQIKMDLTPIAEAMTAMGQQLSQLGTEVEGLKELKKAQTETHLPRFMATVVDNAASKSQATIVKEEDKLLKQKPKETIREDTSKAAFYFGAK